MEKFRIKKISFEGEDECYFILQKQTRLFWIGPKIWETYQVEDYDWCPPMFDWSWLKVFGTRYNTMRTAEHTLMNTILKSRKISETVIKEYSI